MRNKLFLFMSFFSLLAFGQENVTKYVNPFIGTGAVENSLSGNNYPGATVPFGMVQLSPDTRTEVDAELTTTTRAGFHRYNYPQGKQARLIINLNHSRKKVNWDTQIINSQLRQVDEYTIEGYRAISGWASLRKVHFYIRFSKPIVQTIMTDGGTVYANNSILNGRNLKAVLDFDISDSSPLLAKIGISPTSIENARKNLEEEIKDWNFDKTRMEADATWEKELSKIRVEGTELQKEIFYTGLYHTFIQPNTMSDVSGEYMATDFNNRNVSTSGGGIHYSLFSLWDTFRAVHPLYTILQQERTADFVNSMIRQYDTEGYLPVWQLWGQDNYCMIGNHAIPVVVDAVTKEIPRIDKEKAYQAVKYSSLNSHLNSPFDVWEEYGYMPEDIQTQSVSITLEMAFDDL